MSMSNIFEVVKFLKRFIFSTQTLCWSIIHDNSLTNFTGVLPSSIAEYFDWTLSPHVDTSLATPAFILGDSSLVRYRVAFIRFTCNRVTANLPSLRFYFLVKAEFAFPLDQENFLAKFICQRLLLDLNLRPTERHLLGLPLCFFV